MNLFHEIFLGDEKTFSRKIIFFHAALILISVALLYFCSYSTSPRYDSLGDDSSIFQAVGRGWAEGHLPYVDMFENKGALIFLIDALGYMIYPRVGIFFLQIPAMYLSILFAWRALGTFLTGKTKFAAASFMLAFNAFYSLDGNRTEEWCMPFLMAATYFFLRGLKEEKFSCPPLIGLINGLGFGACVLLRTTNALPICCYVFLSAIFLLKAGELKTLWRNVLNFCAGAVIIFLPFVIYFAAHGALYDMLYGTILLNVIYSAQRENYLMTHLAEYASHVVMHFMPLYLLIAVSVLEFVKNKTQLAMSGIFCGAAMLLMLFKLSPYLGYCALITPLLAIFFAVTADFAKNFRALWSVKGFSLKKICCELVLVTAMFYPLIIFYEAGNKIVIQNSANIREYNSEQNLEMLRLAKIIPSEERGSVMCWSEGTHSSHWILMTGIFPNYRFFSNIKAFSNVDPNIKREWLNTARADCPKWIIYSVHVGDFSGEYPDEWTKAFRTNRDADVESLLKENYILAGDTKTYQNYFLLYRLKE